MTIVGKEKNRAKHNQTTETKQALILTFECNHDGAYFRAKN